MQTKFRIIETKDYILAVSDNNTKVGDLIVYNNTLGKLIFMQDDLGQGYEIQVGNNVSYPIYEPLNVVKQIIAYQPKNNAPELDLPLLPEMVEDDVEKLAKIEYPSPKIPDISKTYSLERQAFKRGYKKATKKYSEDDLIDLVKQLKDYTCESHNILGHDERDAKDFVDIFKKSLKQPKWFVVECKTEYTEDGLDYQSDELKTTTINGKTYLVGTYLYE